MVYAGAYAPAYTLLRTLSPSLGEGDRAQLDSGDRGIILLTCLQLSQQVRV